MSNNLVGYAEPVGIPLDEATSLYSRVTNFLESKEVWPLIKSYEHHDQTNPVASQKCVVADTFGRTHEPAQKEETVRHTRFKQLILSDAHFVTIPSMLITLPRKGDSSSRGDMRCNPNLTGVSYKINHLKFSRK